MELGIHKHKETKDTIVLTGNDVEKYLDAQENKEDIAEIKVKIGSRKIRKIRAIGVNTPEFVIGNFSTATFKNCCITTVRCRHKNTHLIFDKETREKVKRIINSESVMIT